MVILLQVLVQGFQSLAQLTFENLVADLMVQQGTKESALPETILVDDSVFLPANYEKYLFLFAYN